MRVEHLVPCYQTIPGLSDWSLDTCRATPHRIGDCPVCCVVPPKGSPDTRVLEMQSEDSQLLCNPPSQLALDVVDDSRSSQLQRILSARDLEH